MALWLSEADVRAALDPAELIPAMERAELGEVIAGRAPGRTGAREITLFKSLGLAVEDLAAPAIAFRRAREMGRGADVRF